jgi:hypothetical protein
LTPVYSEDVTGIRDFLIKSFTQLYNTALPALPPSLYNRSVFTVHGNST